MAYFLKIFFSLIFISKSWAYDESKVFDKMLQYINDSQNSVMNFIQSDSSISEPIHGTIILIASNKKFRINYYYPGSLLIVGNEYHISIYDYELNSVIRLGADEYFNVFFFNSYDEFSKNFKIIKYAVNHEYAKFSVINKMNNTIIELDFSVRSKQLITLVVKEPENEIITHFLDSQKICFADNKLFFIKNPDKFGPPERLSREKLKAFYR